MNFVSSSSTFASGPRRAATSTSYRPLRWLDGAALAVAAGGAQAQAQCSVSASGLNFAGYDVFSAAHNDSTATITVNCSEGTAYSIALSSANGTSQQPLLSSIDDTLNLNRPGFRRHLQALY